MHSTEDPGDEGLAGQNIGDAKWCNGHIGVQAPEWDYIAASTPRPNPIESNEALGNGDFLDGTVQEDLGGFAPVRWAAKPYQERGVEWLATRPAGALFLPPGMGKTSITLAAREVVGNMGMNNRMLVVAPLTVCLTTWLTEPLKWFQFYGLKVGLAHGPDKALVLNDPYYDIVVLNYDGLEWAAKLLAPGHSFGILVLDELTRVKNTRSKRFKVLKPLLPTFTFRWGLTGTPAANGLTDLFGQCFVLDLGTRLGRFITHFRLKYLYQEPWDQYRYYIKPEKAELLIETISDMCMYLDPKDHLQLPGLMDVVLNVTLDKSDMLAYKLLEEDFIVKLHDDVVTAANAGVLTSKLRQFTGGGMYINEDRAWTDIHHAKIDRLAELVEEMAGEPLLVAYQFNHELERLLMRFPDALAIKGGMKPGVLSEVVGAWNTGNVPILFVQPAAAAHGINLQFGGAALCWFSMTYNLEEYSQLIARLYRQGQKQVVRNYLLLADKTIDYAVYKIMSQKEATQESVFLGLKRLMS